MLLFGEQSGGIPETSSLATGRQRREKWACGRWCEKNLQARCVVAGGVSTCLKPQTDRVCHGCVWKHNNNMNEGLSTPHCVCF